MKRKLTLTLLLATAALVTGAQTTNTNRTQICEDPVPFKFGGHIYLPLIIDNEHHANMVFDTGASGQLLIDTIYLAEQHWRLDSLKNAKMSGAYGYTRVKVSWKEHVVEHGKVWESVPYMILGDLRGILGKPADGLLRSNDVETHPLEINYQYRFLRKLNTIPDSVKRNYQSIPLTFHNGKCIIKATVWFNGKPIEGLYNIDTGSGGDIDFTEETTKKYDMESYKGTTYTGHGLGMGIGDGGISTWTDALADSMQIGTLNIRCPEITIHPTAKGALEKNIFVGNIGAGIFCCYNLVLDIPNGKLYCRPYKEYQFAKRALGFGWINRTDIGKGWIVRSIYDGSPADKAGMKLGDIIIEVDGKKVEDYTWEEEQKLRDKEAVTLLLKTPAGQRTVTIQQAPLYVASRP